MSKWKFKFIHTSWMCYQNTQISWIECWGSTAGETNWVKSAEICNFLCAPKLQSKKSKATKVVHIGPTTNRQNTLTSWISWCLDLRHHDDHMNTWTICFRLARCKETCDYALLPCHMPSNQVVVFCAHSNRSTHCSTSFISFHGCTHWGSICFSLKRESMVWFVPFQDRANRHGTLSNSTAIGNQDQKTLALRKSHSPNAPSLI
jgi:hypothetical protein